MNLFLAKSTIVPGTLGCRREFLRHLLHRISTLAFAACSALFTQALWTPSLKAEPNHRPNILLLLADDLGYGDVSCFNPQSLIQTTHLDRLAAGGMRFTDAHSPTAICTPTRYALLTGRYSWRTRLDRGVLLDFDEPLIDEDRLTLPAYLRRHGYQTAAIGKWHLGWNWGIDAERMPLFKRQHALTPPVTQAHLEAWRGVFSQPIAGGPVDRGFDSYFGTAVPNLPPYGFFRDRTLVGIPTMMKPRGSVSDVGNITTTGPAGPMVAGHEFDKILPKLGEEAESYLQQRAADDQPFFLYLSLTSPHFPVVPSARFRGRTGLGDLADFIVETDAVCGRVLDALKEHHLDENTVVMFSSDNGPAVNSRTPLNVVGHDGSGGLRGKKQSIYEGGHRVPTIIRWPGRTPPGSVCDDPITLACPLATMADWFDEKLPVDAAEDSFSILPALSDGRVDRPTHPLIVLDSGASVLAVRWRQWKLIALPDGGSELYRMDRDRAESFDHAPGAPKMVVKLNEMLQKAIDRGRTTPGPPQSNDRVVLSRTAGQPVSE